MGNICNKLMEDVLLVDVGGTNTRFATKTAGTSNILRVEKFDSNRHQLMALLNDYSKHYSNLSISVAGPIIDDHVDITFNDFSLDKSELKPYFSSVQMINDYQAAANGLIGLDGKLYEMEHGDINNKKMQMVFGVGTGVGISARYDDKVFSTEAGFLPMTQMVSNDAKQYLEWRQHNNKSLELHTIVAREGILDLIDYADEAVDKTNKEYYDNFFIKDTYKMKDIWTELAAKAMQQAALVFKPEGGIFLTGGTLHRYAFEIDWYAFRQSFIEHDNTKIENMLKTVPIARLKREIVLEGCYNVYKMNLNGSADK